jgi:hypothetical protein
MKHLMRIYKHTVEDGCVEVTTLWKCKGILAMTTWGRVVLVPRVQVGEEVELLKRVEGRSKPWLDRRWSMEHGILVIEWPEKRWKMDGTNRLSGWSGGLAVKLG